MKADPRAQFEALAGRFRERPAGEAAGGRPSDMHALYVQGVDSGALRELVDADARATLRFYARGVDLTDLEGRPSFSRWPQTAWRLFVAVASRMGPARRLLFALAVPVIAFAWADWLLGVLVRGRVDMPWLLLAATVSAFLLVLELRDKLLLKGDLEIAREIQFALLPFAPVERPGLFVHAAMRPANTVGGDYFDVVDLPEGRTAVVVGDVAGKGMPAALLMALLQGSLRTLLGAGLRGAALVRQLNEHLHAHIPSNRLVTLVYTEYDAAAGELRYVNAGHNAPFALRGGDIARLPATGIALGVKGDAAYDEIALALAPGERVFFYTDGVTEAFDPADCEYGEERLQGYLDRHRAVDGPALLDGLREDVLRHCGSARPHDDMTMLVLTRR